jgi:hypothetical protein
MLTARQANEQGGTMSNHVSITKRVTSILTIAFALAIAAPAAQAYDYHQPSGPAPDQIVPGRPIPAESRAGTPDWALRYGTDAQGDRPHGRSHPHATTSPQPLGPPPEQDARAAERTRVPAVAAPVETAAGFDWADAGLGAGVALATVLVLFGALSIVRRRRTLAGT